jgi:hypothetical protein
LKPYIVKYVLKTKNVHLVVKPSIFNPSLLARNTTHKSEGHPNSGSWSPAVITINITDKRALSPQFSYDFFRVFPTFLRFSPCFPHFSNGFPGSHHAGQEGHLLIDRKEAFAARRFRTTIQVQSLGSGTDRYWDPPILFGNLIGFCWLDRFNPLIPNVKPETQW